jgi:transcriptional regulator with XRE-family HTH domain
VLSCLLFSIRTQHLGGILAKQAKSPSEAAAEELRRVRTRKGWNQQQLADQLHELGAPIDRATISKIETGDRRITLDEVFWFSYAFGVTPTALILPRPFGSRVAVTPTTSLQAWQAMDWLRGSYVGRPPENESDEIFFQEERIEEDAVAWRRYPELTVLRDEAAIAVRIAVDDDTSDLRHQLYVLQQLVDEALRKLKLIEKRATRSEPAKSKGPKGKGQR